MSTETLQKLYLELAHVVPPDCISFREIRLGRIADQYGSDNARLEQEAASLHVVVERLSAALITVANIGSGEAKRVALEALRLCEIEP